MKNTSGFVRLLNRFDIACQDKSKDFVDVIKTALKNDAAWVAITGGDIVRISKIEIDKASGILTLLLRRRNETISTQVFEHGETKVLREPEKSPKEAPAYSCHLFIRIKPEPGEPYTHRAILEEVTGIGYSYVWLLLRTILRAVEYEYSDVRLKKNMTYTVIKIGAVQSETLANALRGGGMNYVDLEKPPNTKDLDNEGIVARPITMRLAVKAQHKHKVALLNKVRAWAKANDWPDMRVQIETSDDKTRVVEIARDVDAAATLFSKAELVSTKASMKSCSATVNDELLEHAGVFFKSRKGWN